MKLKSTLLIFLMVFLAMNACKDVEEPGTTPITENPDPDPDPQPQDPVNLPTLEITVIFPEGVNPDLSGAKVIGGLKEFPLDGNSSKVFVTQGNSQLAFLQDKEDNILLLGFINEKNKTLSIQSSAEALAFLAMGGFALPQTVRSRYPDEAGSITGMDAFKKKLSDLFKSDPLVFEKESYLSDLGEFVRTIYERGEEIDIRARQINVDPTGYKSGIQVFENDFQSILIRNQYLRKAHAFIYKKNYKDKEGTRTVLISSTEFNSSGSPEITSEKALDPANRSGGVMGVLTDQMAGNGLQVFMKENGPVSIPLGANESEAEYAVRVVGPTFSNLSRNRMTTKEQEKYDDIVFETFLEEILIPVINQILGMNSGDSESGNDSQLKSLLSSFKSEFIKQFPGVMEKVEEGKYSEALQEILEKVLIDPIKDAAEGKAKNMLLEYVYLKNAKEPEFGNFYDDREIQSKKRTDKFLRAYGLINKGLKFWDSSRLFAHIKNSSPIEEFTVTAREHDIKLLPREASVTVFTNREFTVETKTELTDGQAFLYKWSTSGTYGTIRDNLGNNGTKFENGQKTITYRAEGSNIPDGAKETITVEAYVKQGPNEIKIGEATSTVSVKPAQLVIRPHGVTLSGKDKQKIALHVEWANGDAFENTSIFDYKYEWSTPGQYGKFDGSMTHATTSGPRTSYQALDEEVEEAEEDLKVDVYMRNKEGGDWFKYHSAEGTIKVNNDENTKILQLPIIVESYEHLGSRFPGSTSIMQVSFLKEEEHEAYTVRFYGFNRQLNPSLEGRTYTWRKDQPMNSAIDLARYLRRDTFGGVDFPENQVGIFVHRGFISCTNINAECNNDHIVENLKSLGGMVEVKIKLK